jgi:hypothetical protein
MIASCFRHFIDSAERDSTDVASALVHLRNIPLDDFGLLLMSMPSETFPNLSRLLPRMASPQVQRDWAGADGVTLLHQSLAFARVVSQGYRELTGKPLDQKRVFDFGLGWGRIVRLMYYYCDPVNIYGCDPWDRSLDICRNDGVACNLSRCDYLPTSLPFDGKFDLIYAMSVFTHLSERATTQALRVLGNHLVNDGVLIITIRPVEYWLHHNPISAELRDNTIAHHNENGFAFIPHNLPPIDGDVTYGDTSMTTKWIEALVPELRIRRVDRTLTDPFQLIVMLTR